MIHANHHYLRHMKNGRSIKCRHENVHLIGIYACISQMLSHGSIKRKKDINFSIKFLIWLISKGKMNKMLWNINMYSRFGYFVKCWYFNMDLLPNKIFDIIFIFYSRKISKCDDAFPLFMFDAKNPDAIAWEVSYLWSFIW